MEPESVTSGQSLYGYTSMGFNCSTERKSKVIQQGSTTSVLEGRCVGWSVILHSCSEQLYTPILVHSSIRSQ
uniref:Uncharacterized protein n=1 Tax=Anguilla anguilla TaxID=7936 RepID=A0A0E9WN26_ANGAN